MYSYKLLENKLNEIGLTKSDLTTQLGISSRTIAKISKGRTIRSLVLSCQDYMHSPFHTIPVRHTWDADRIIQMAQSGQC